MISGDELDELRQLCEENARLKKLLTNHDIAWEEPTATAPIPATTKSAPAPTQFTAVSNPPAQQMAWQRPHNERHSVY